MSLYKSLYPDSVHDVHDSSVGVARGILTRKSVFGPDSAWYKKHPDRAVLSHANLLKARLENASMIAAVAEYACFLKAEISSVDMGGADMRHANFCDARLQAVSFHRSRLDHAQLAGATLTDTDRNKALREGVGTDGRERIEKQDGTVEAQSRVA